MLLDRTGAMLSAPIVGGDTAGLYGGYLDNAFAEAARKLSAERWRRNMENEDESAMTWS